MPTITPPVEEKKNNNSEYLKREREADRKGKRLEIIPILTAMFWIVAQTGNHSLQLASWTAKEDKQVACEIIL